MDANKEQQPIPREIADLIDHESDIFGNEYANDYEDSADDAFEISLSYGHRTGAKFMYRHLAPEIAQLKAERDCYRKALEKIKAGFDKEYKGMKTWVFKRHDLMSIASKAVDQYPSPKDTDNV